MTTYPHAGLYPPDDWPNQYNAITPGASVGIYAVGTSTLATLYATRDRTGSVANPLTLDANGNNPLFYADPGPYDARRLTNGVPGVPVRINVVPDDADAVDVIGSGGSAYVPLTDQGTSYTVVADPEYWIGAENAVGSYLWGGTNGLPNTVNQTGSAAMLLWCGGGYDHSIGGIASTICGGGHHTADATGGHAFIGGGSTHTIHSSYAAIVGGLTNLAYEHYAFMGGGRQNVTGVVGEVGSATGDQVLCGGYQNVASGKKSVVVGGLQNTASGLESVCVGGYLNTASGENATVGGGEHNVATADYATVAGGQLNTASGAHAFVGGGVSNTASGVKSTVIGGDVNTASGVYAVASGARAKADKQSQWAHAAGQIAAQGDAQTSVIPVHATTTNLVATELHGVAVADRLTIADDTTWAFAVLVVARRTDANGESAAYKFEGCIARDAGTVRFVGTPVKTVLAEDTVAWDCNAVADDTNKALSIVGTGEVGKNIQWVARVELAETTG